MYINYAIWGDWLGGPKDDFFLVVVGMPQWEKANFVGRVESAVQCNVGRENVALRCKCSIPTAD